MSDLLEILSSQPARESFGYFGAGLWSDSPIAFVNGSSKGTNPQKFLDIKD
jgi:hypothetical protein